MSEEQIKAFVNLVADMRQAQVDYFRTRDKNQLSLSKSLEKKVDKAIADFKSPQTKLL